MPDRDRPATHPRTRCAVGAILLASSAFAQAPENPEARRPRVGLVLGGGGARGGAHVGVLKELERLHVPVDFVAGTSMGAIVGGLYASGVPVEKIESVLTGLNWSDILADRAAYRDLAWRRKEDDGRYFPDIELGLHHGKIVVPTGLRGGQKLAFELQALLLPVAGVHDFSKLPIPFKAVASDLGTGEAVVLDHGELADSILASMAIPAFFAPVEIDGKLLVDGGMASNLPVEVMRAMGADVVIAVDVGTQLQPPESIRSFVGVTDQSLTFLVRLNSERSAALADIVIRPDLRGITAADFPAVPEAIRRGEEAANGAAEVLERLAIDAGSFRHEVDERTPAPPPVRRFDYVRVEGNVRVHENVILARAGVRPGDPIDVGRLRGAVRRVFGMDDFQWVRFRIEDLDGRTGLVLHVKEKPWGPTYLHFGLVLADDFRGGATYGVRANLTRADLNARGGEWRNDVQVGSNMLLRSELFQPFDAGGRFFVAPWLAVGRERQGVYEDGRRIATYAVASGGAELDFGVAYGRFGELRAGVYRNRVHARVDTGGADLPKFDADGGGAAFRMHFDTRNRPSIPTRGSSLEVDAKFSRPGLGASDSYDRVEASAEQFFGRDRHTGFITARVGTALGSGLPVYDDFLVGGLFSLGGYSEGELRGKAAGGMSVGYHYRLRSLPPGLGEGIYVGCIADAANAWPSSEDVSFGSLRYGVTVMVGADSVAGPLFVAFGHGEGGRNRVYLTLGRSF